MPKKIPSYKHMWLYRTGLKIEPSQNFIDKFIEIYNDFLHNNSNRANAKDLDNDTAIFMINSILEAIIYCLDFGFDVWLHRTMVFIQKTRDKISTNGDGQKKVSQNVKTLVIKPIESIKKAIKNLANTNNEPYQQFLLEKKERHEKIKQYYKEFYAKEEDWW